MPSPKIVLTADRTLMSLYRGLSLATFFGCAPALDPNRDKSSIWYKILGNQVTPKILYKILFLSRFRSSAGAHPKNVANESPRYKDISVRSAVKTIFGLGIMLKFDLSYLF